MNNTVNAISHDSDQSPFRGGLSQRANSLADALNRAEFVECVPALRKPWAVAQHHPLVKQYMKAKLAVVLSLAERRVLPPPVSVTGVVTDTALDRIKAKRLSGGLRRAVDLWARIEARSDFAKKK
jgi:hypothetical protein